MSIKDLPHVTVEQVLALRKAAIELEQELATAKQEKKILKVAFDGAIAGTKEWSDMYLDLKASLPKVRADAFTDGAIWERESSFHKDIEIEAEAYAIQLEAGNE